MHKQAETLARPIWMGEFRGVGGWGGPLGPESTQQPTKFKADRAYLIISSGPNQLPPAPPAVITGSASCNEDLRFGGASARFARQTERR